jgi:hypothetical protein
LREKVNEAAIGLGYRCFFGTGVAAAFLSSAGSGAGSED